MTTAALDVQQVTKRFAGRTAVEQVSFRLAAGERVALIGHNGAGKTTLIKMVLGFLAPTTGNIAVLGKAPGSTEARLATTYLPEAVAFHPSLTGREVMTFFARLRGEDARGIGALLDRVGLGEAGRRRVGTYSKGMRQRLGLAQALIGTPSLVLLDEPTSGLDPLSRQDFYRIVAKVADRGATVLLSSHALSEVEAKTDRVLILARGRLVANDSLAGLRAAAKLPIRLCVQGTEATAQEIAERLGGKRVNGRSVEIMCRPEDKVARLAAVAALGPLVSDVDVAQPSLDDVYRYFSGFEEQER